MSLTMSELAARIGVSTATISRVLKNDKSVSEETRGKVLAALHESGCEKRSLRSSAQHFPAAPSFPLFTGSPAALTLPRSLTIFPNNSDKNSKHIKPQLRLKPPPGKA